MRRRERPRSRRGLTLRSGPPRCRVCSSTRPFSLQPSAPLPRAQLHVPTHRLHAHDSVAIAVLAREAHAGTVLARALGLVAEARIDVTAEARDLVVEARAGDAYVQLAAHRLGIDLGGRSQLT